MKKIILFLSLGLLFNAPVLAETKCFLAKENNKIIKQEGDCKSRHSPASTFKIALSLMGYNEKILIDETHPKLPFKEGYTDWLDNWKQSHTPRLWMKNSCVWYSQIITKKLGIKKFQDYLAKFNYGNQDISGDKGKNNSLINSWIGSSLKISPEEQTVFLQNFLDQKLPVSSKAHAMTRNIMVVEDLVDSWKFYGKTGMSDLHNADGTEDENRQMGWFVGWIQKGERSIVFAHYVEDQAKQDTYASLRAKAAAKEKLIKIIKSQK